MTTTRIFRRASDNTQSSAAAATGRLAGVAAIILSLGIAAISLLYSEAVLLPLKIAFHIAVSNR